MIDVQLKNFFYISLISPFKTMKKLNGVFKPLKRHFRCGKSWHPVLWCFKPSLIQIISRDVEWKDKWHTPRYEGPPYIWIHLFGFNLVWYWDLSYNDKEHYIDAYWEQALWYLYYASYNKEKKGYDELDINKAKKSWPWANYETNETTWEDKYLIE